MVGFGVEIENHDLIRPCFQPRFRDIESVLRPDVPEPAQQVTVDPRHALALAAHVEVSVASLAERKRPSQETRAQITTSIGLESDAPDVLHRERINLPSMQYLPAKRHGPHDAFPFVAKTLAEIDTSPVFHQDVEHVLGLTGMKRNCALS